MDTIYQIIPKLLPFECLDAAFMQRALIGLVMLAPMGAMMGVQVVNFRMAFYADAISHTAFAGVALGLLLGFSPYWVMPVFALFIGMGIVFVQRRSLLSSDTVIGVVFSAVVAFGLAIVSRNPNISRDMLRFLYGDILTITQRDITCLAGLFIILVLFQFFGYNRLIYSGLNPVLAQTHRVKVAAYQYTFAAFLSLIVIFSVWWVGILLVTGMLIIPAASARNFAKSAGSMFWWALVISISSAITGFIISAQEWAQTATGATIVLVTFCWFLVSSGFGAIRVLRLRYRNKCENG